MTTFKYEGQTYELNSYVDPAPGLKGTDKAKTTCGKCGGDGLYHAPSGYQIANPYGRGAIKGCFDCMGLGYRMVAVSTVRRYARQDAFFTEYADMVAELRAAANAERQAAELAANFARDWDAAHAEQTRRAAMVQGFVGEVGEKVAFRATVNFAKYTPSQQYGWSASMFITATTEAGQVVVVKGSGESLFALERGAVVDFTGKVKDYGSFNGQQQTVVSHAKAKEVAIDA